MVEEADGGYAAARATLRDTVKWLAAAFASIAAVIVAGSPLATTTDVDVKAPAFWVSVVFAFVALGCVAWGVRISLELLRPDGLYASQLGKPKAGEPAEISEARKEIEDNHADLLPDPLESPQQLLEERSKTLALMDEEPQADRRTKLEEHLALLESHLSRILDFAIYRVLYHRLEAARLRLFVLGLATLAALMVSVAAGKAAKAESASAPTVFIVGGTPAPTPSGSLQPATADDPIPRLEPVRFAPLSAQLTPEGIEATRKARDFLQRDPRCSLLLAAHTDTMAGDAVNVQLARRRGNAVRTLLLEQGGVAASRVFVSELPESSLPSLTGDQVRESSNRSVEFFIARVAASPVSANGPGH